MRLLKISATAAAILAIAMNSPVEAQATLSKQSVPNTHQALQVPASYLVKGGLAVNGGKLYFGQGTGIEVYNVSPFAQNAAGIVTTWTAGMSGGTFNAVSNAQVMFSNVYSNVFYFCSKLDPAIYRYNTASDTINRMAGNSATAGATAGTGTAARVACEAPSKQSSAQNADGTVLYFATYAAAAGSSKIFKMTVSGPTETADAGVVALIAGDGANAHSDGDGASAQFNVVTTLLYYKNPSNAEFLILTSDDNAGVVRYISALGTTNTVATATLAHSPSFTQSGQDAAGLTPYANVLSRRPGENVAVGFTKGTTAPLSKLFLLSWSDDLLNWRIDFSEVDRGVYEVEAGQFAGNYLYTGTSQSGFGAVSKHLAVGVPTRTQSLPGTPEPPTPEPTPEPSVEPTSEPSVEPTSEPTPAPTPAPTVKASGSTPQPPAGPTPGGDTTTAAPEEVPLATPAEGGSEAPLDAAFGSSTTSLLSVLLAALASVALA